MTRAHPQPLLPNHHHHQLNDKLRPMGGAAKTLQKVFRGGAARVAHGKLLEQKRQTMKQVNQEGTLTCSARQAWTPT